MLANWKTTLGGVGAILGAAASLATMFSKGQVDGTMLMTDLGIIGAGFTGLFAKDHNVTGGTVRQ
jgi:flagellar hook protein FlgE